MNSLIVRRLLHRPAESNKYDFGHVLILGGSPGMVGAPLLTGKAALRTGAGLVTIAAPQHVTEKLERRVEEIMTLALPAAGALRAVRRYIADHHISVLVLGPGLQPTAGNNQLVKSLVKSQTLPIIIDGGALAALHGNLNILRNNHSPAIILTPHQGEFQRLTGASLPNRRIKLKSIARQFAKDYGVILVLKGHPTYVAHPAARLYTNPTGNPGLATAGTGDVLAGIVAGLLGQGIPPRDASEAGVYLHGLAGDIAARAKTEPGMIAGDVIEAIPEALHSFDT